MGFIFVITVRVSLNLCDCHDVIQEMWRRLIVMRVLLIHLVLDCRIVVMDRC